MKYGSSQNYDSLFCNLLIKKNMFMVYPTATTFTLRWIDLRDYFHTKIKSFIFYLQKKTSFFILCDLAVQFVFSLNQHIKVDPI